MSQVKELYRPKLVFTVLCIINLFNYIDRGIIPGSTVEFNKFIQNDISTNTPDVYLGLLQSAFVVGLVIGSVIFANFVHHYPEFFVMGIGLSIFVAANVLAGISENTGSYAFLLIARSVSGFGEAAMQSVAPPWIEASAPKGYSGTWLSIFFTAIPVGTAIGYTYSSVVSTSIGWQFAFYIEAILIAPFVASLFYFSRFYPLHRGRSALIRESSRSPVVDRSSASQLPSGDVELTTLGQNSPPRPSDTQHDSDGSGSTKSATYTPLEKPEEVPSIWQEAKIILSEPLYLCLTLANAAQTGSLIGVATFGSAFLLGLGYYNTESQSSTVFGIVISLAGIVGTPLGGYLLDRHKEYGGIRATTESERTVTAAEEEQQQHQAISNSDASENTGLNIETRMSSEVDARKEELKRCPQHNITNALRMDHTFSVIFFYTILGTALLCCAYFVMDKVGFITMICIGCTAIFLTNPGIYWGCMLVSHPKHRAFAVALNTVIEHVFGDVPSPIIAGYIKDSLAPDCVADKGATDDEIVSVATSTACRNENHGLRVTMTVVFAYMIVTALFFALGWLINRQRIQKHREEEASLAAKNEAVSSATVNARNSDAEV